MADFVAQYGGTAEWEAAGARMEAERQRQAAEAAERQRQAALAAAAAAGARRIDPEDGNAYTREEFIEAYGGTAEWDRAQPPGGLGAVPAAAAPAPPDLSSMSRADQIRHKQAAQKAKIQALKQAKADEVAAAEAQRVAEEQARIQAIERAAAEAQAAAAADRARQQAEQQAAAEMAAKEAKRQEQFAASANQAAALKRKALEKRQAAMADPLGLAGGGGGGGGGGGCGTPAASLPTDDPWGFVASTPAPAPAAPAPAPAPAATPYSASAFGGLAGPPAAGGGGGTYTVVLPKTAAGFGIKLNNTPTGDAFVEGFSHAGPQQAGIVVGSIFVSVAGVAVSGRGQVRARCRSCGPVVSATANRMCARGWWSQEGVIAVLRHPQYGANPNSPSVPFEFKLPDNQI
jgi:hypothetical protein